MTAAILWTTFSSGLKASETFTALAIVVITSLSMARAMLCYPIFVSTLGCFQRIQTYLLLEERQDRRRNMNDIVLSNGYPSEKHASYHSVSPMDKSPLELQAPQTCISVMFVNASMAAVAGKEPLLKSVNVSVSRSKLAVVLGRTGCGKSTFLRAIIGEAYLTDGHVYVERHQIAYCDQTPWLKNTPIRANITGDHAYDKDWYKTVVDACLLGDDIQQFPNGDQTLSGDNGSNLSGGQKQRIALARAVYSQASLLVLDNVLSALDRGTADAIFSRLFASGGLLRRLGSTVVMTIHSAEYINSADQTLVIGDGGSIKSVAGLGDVGQCQEDVTEWLSPSAGEETEEKDEATDEAQDACKESGTAANNELLIRRQGDFGLYSFYLKSTAKWLWAIWLVTVIFVAVAERLPEIFLRIWLDVAPDNKVYLVGYILFGFSSFTAAGITLSLYYLKIVPNSSENLHRVLLDKVMGSTLSFLSSTSNGSLLNLFSQDMSLISQDLPLAFFRLLYSFFLLITDIGIIAAGATYISVIIPFILICVYIIQYFYLRTSRQMRYIDLEAKAPLYTQFSEISAGLMHIRSFGWDSQCLSRSRQLLDDSQKPFYYMFCIQRWLGLVSELCVLGVATILVSVALCFRGTTSQNAMGLSMLTLIQFGDSILTLLNTWIDTETSLGAIARIKSFAETTPGEEDVNSGGAELPAGYLKQGAIKMVGVTATYNSLDASSPALDNVSLDIKPGQKVAVVGRTGSGKSSLLLTMLHFLNYTGVIEIDGVDMSRIPRQHLRSLITTIPQDMVELPGTLRDNVLPIARTRPASHIRDAEIGEVLDRVRLKEYVDSHGGLDTPFADMGFSHGQKQLLAIARAILHKLEVDSRILLVDEATSAMDVDTAKVMKQVIDDVFGDCTVIAISHQPTDIGSADLVLHVEDGKVT
ncbi:hypothetical protein J3458_014468 [Metarhizium acridum]|uniref:uncharacterized protein n=1 Tax=Metarhizium acridum TaxID=92637 RepID=UPI001C6AE36A|nr:hypothetical protein J3458_014468 [Metarhizium acridum]